MLTDPAVSNPESASILARLIEFAYLPSPPSAWQQATPFPNQDLSSCIDHPHPQKEQQLDKITSVKGLELLTINDAPSPNDDD